jgi:hypothetical protein
VAWFAFRGPHVALCADGVIVRRWWSGPTGQIVAWDDIVADRLPAPSLRARRVELLVRADGGDQRVRLAVGWLWVNPEFLLCAIEHYAEHPDNRGAIGTRDELRRLGAALRGQPAAVSGRGTPSAAHAK